ncbi:MAG: Gfo/Idh/MocA family oxidoreductase [Actinomycetales bacterium]
MASRILVIGAGRMGAIRAEDLMAHVDQVLIANRTAQRADDLAERLGAATVPFDAVLDERVDGYVLTTATAAHAGMFEQLIHTGRPILIEKPLALGLTDSRRMARLASSALVNSRSPNGSNCSNCSTVRALAIGVETVGC